MEKTREEDGCNRHFEDGRPEVLRAQDVSVTFGVTKALRGVTLSVHEGEVLALAGVNGAGKSTLTAVLSGIIQPTQGSLFVEGHKVHLHSVADATGAGIQTIVQDFDSALLPWLTVSENLVFPDLSQGRLGVFPSRREVRARASRIAAAGSLDIPLDARVGELGTSDRQRVLIARALSTNPRVLILDEPTASLDSQESARLADDVRRLSLSGTAVIYISHHMEEIAHLCDRALVLRDGLCVGDFSSPLDIREVVRAMLAVSDASESGTDRSAVPRSSTATQDGRRSADAEVVLGLRGVRAFAGSDPVDLDLHEGEILGITGLIGAGKTEMLSQVVGSRPLLSGSMSLQGKPFRPRHPGDAVKAGVGYVPEDRASQGEIHGWSVENNIALPDLRRHRSALGLVDASSVRRAAARTVKDLGIVGSPRDPIESLSGGNRQKTVIGRWIAAGSRLLVMDEPFRGVDIGARADIAACIRRSGTALVAASDPEEILQVADRILVLSHGSVTADVNARNVDRNGLSALIAAGA